MTIENRMVIGDYYNEDLPEISDKELCDKFNEWLDGDVTSDVDLFVDWACDYKDSHELAFGNNAQKEKAMRDLLDYRASLLAKEFNLFSLFGLNDYKISKELAKEVLDKRG